MFLISYCVIFLLSKDEKGLYRHINTNGGHELTATSFLHSYLPPPPKLRINSLRTTSIRDAGVRGQTMQELNLGPLTYSVVEEQLVTVHG